MITKQNLVLYTFLLFLKFISNLDVSKKNLKIKKNNQK